MSSSIFNLFVTDLKHTPGVRRERGTCLSIPPDSTVGGEMSSPKRKSKGPGEGEGGGQFKIKSALVELGVTFFSSLNIFFIRQVSYHDDMLFISR